MSNEYLRAFVIGSSCLIFLPFFYAVIQFKEEKFNLDYGTYTLFAPVTLGIMNMISLFVATKYHLSKRIRFLLTSLIAPTVVLSSIIYFNTYNYTQSEWISHIFGLYLLYFIVFNVILYSLERHV